MWAISLVQASNTSLHKCVLSTCQAVSCASTYSFYAAQFAVQILEEAIFEPTADSVLIVSRSGLNTVDPKNRFLGSNVENSEKMLLLKGRMSYELH